MSSELKEAYDELDLAIQKVCRAAGLEDGKILGDWAVIAAEHSFNDGETDRTTYTTLFRGGHLSYHICIGLFSTALELISDRADDEA